MDVDSTISSGRSTPVMMNGQGVTTSSAKSIAYNCCWDQCHSCFNSSPDLADHIRSIHVDGQRGGVGVFLKICPFNNICVLDQGLSMFYGEKICCYSVHF